MQDSFSKMLFQELIPIFKSFKYQKHEHYPIFYALLNKKRVLKTSSLSQNYRCGCLPLLKKYHGNKHFYHQKSIDKH